MKESACYLRIGLLKSTQGNPLSFDDMHLLIAITKGQLESSKVLPILCTNKKFECKEENEDLCHHLPLGILSSIVIKTFIFNYFLN